MATGIIRRIMHRGYGFITPDEGGDDVFFHAIDLVEGISFHDLHEEQRVEFELKKDKKGSHASQVSVIG